MLPFMLNHMTERWAYLRSIDYCFRTVEEEVKDINWKQPPDGCEKVPVLMRTIQTAKRCWRTWCWEWQRGSISTPWGLCWPVGEVSLEGRRVSRVGTRSYFDWQMSRWWWWMVMMFPVHRKQTCPTKKIFWIWFIWGYALYYFVDIVKHTTVQAVTGLGDAVLASPALSRPITLTILAGLAWPDSPSSTKVYKTQE